MTSESLAAQTIQEAMSSESESSATPSTEEASSQPQKPTPKHEFEVHNEIVLYLVFLHDNVHIVSYSDSGTMCKWNCNTGLLVGEPWGDKGEDEGRDSCTSAFTRREDYCVRKGWRKC